MSFTKLRQRCRLTKKNELNSDNWLKPKLINIICRHSFLGRFEIQSFHVFIGLYHVGAVLKGFIESSYIHVLRVMVNKHLLLVYLHESLPESVQHVSRPSVIRQRQHAVIHIQWSLVAVADFEAFLVPVYHAELLGQSFHISVDVRNFDMSSSYNEATRQVKGRLVTLLDQLI